ncbi:MAG: GNAT family N-acetyltransferase [Gemmatimonadota bacterium]|nr:GNAT family N-acetyltransferase [Gemmatimonadota bacterium]
MEPADRALARLPGRIETPRLILEPWTPAGAEEVREAVAESVDTLRPWVPWAPASVPTHADAVALVATWIRQREAGENLIYAVRRRDDATLVGGAGLHDRVGPGRIEVGYWIRRSQERQGFATEAAGALVRAALGGAGFVEVVMHIHPANAASRRVPEKLGFRLAGTRPAAPPAQGRPDGAGGGDELLVFALASTDLRHPAAG